MTDWIDAKKIASQKFTCSYCSSPIASDIGFQRYDKLGYAYTGFVYVCHHCDAPTYFDELGRQFPGVTPGEAVAEIADESVRTIYAEARAAFGAGAFTASAMCSRKLLMNLAVAKGAKAGLSFQDYVNWLVDNHFAPPGSRDWVDHIRRTGNDANHEIHLVKKTEAEDLLTFLALLLRYLYEFPAKMAKKRTI